MVEGVSKGSILGVILFGLGFNDVVSCISSRAHCSLYMDDLAMYISRTNLLYLVGRLQLTTDNPVI